MATTSLGVVSPSLRSQGIIQKPIGQIILFAALIADIGTMLLIPVVMFFLSGEKSIDFLYTGLILVGILAVYFFGKIGLPRAHNNPLFETSQIVVRGSFAIILFFVVMAKNARLEIILGAFIAGILYSFLFNSYRKKIRPKLEAIGYGFLIPVFFVSIGVSFDFTKICGPWSYLLGALLLYIAYLVKLIPVLVLRKYFSWRQTLGTGFLLSARLSLIITISFLAMQEGIISLAIHSMLVFVAMITCLLSPLLFALLFPHES